MTYAHNAVNYWGSSYIYWLTTGGAIYEYIPMDHRLWCTNVRVLVQVQVMHLYGLSIVQQYRGSPYVWCHGQSGRNDASHTRRGTRPERTPSFLFLFLQKRRKENLLRRNNVPLKIFKPLHMYVESYFLKQPFLLKRIHKRVC